MIKRFRTPIIVMVLLVVAVMLSGCGVPQGNLNLDQPSGIWQAFVFVLARALIFLNNAIAGLGVAYSWGWAIIVFTLIIKVITLPLTLKQLQSAKATQELQPKLQELQQKYGKDRQKLADEQMKLYKESGVNPMGGCLPLLIQMPILFGLYQSLYVLANKSIGQLENARFYWIPNLAFPDLQTGMKWISESISTHNWYMLVAYASLPVIMTISQLVLQKMTQPAAAGPSKSDKPDQTQMMGQMMMIMPLFFGYITLGLPSGLSLYWATSNILSIVQQYFVTGWGGLSPWIAGIAALIKPKPQPELAKDLGEPATTGTSADKEIKRRRRRK